MIKKLLIILCLSILCGCSYEGHLKGVNPNPEILIYKDFDAFETYNEAIKFFNNNTYYYKEYIEKNNTDIVNSYYKEEDRIHMSELNIYSYQGLHTLSYSCFKDNDLHVLYLGEDDLYVYEKLEDNYFQREEMYLDITQKEGYTLLSIEREDLNSEVKLTLKIEDSHSFRMGGSYTYMIKELFIDKEGYINKEDISYYEDYECKKEADQPVSIYYKRINDYEYTSIDKEIELLSDCTNHSYEEIIEIINK